MNEVKAVRTTQVVFPSINKPINISLATGSKAILYQELVAKNPIANNMSTIEDIQNVCKIVANFSDWSEEELFDTLTPIELMNLMLAIQGDFEAIKNLTALNK